MKKILIFFLLLLNLQITTDSGSVSIDFGEISAQSMKDEYLDEVIVPGSTPRCKKCGEIVYGDQWKMENHMKFLCSHRTEKCGFCWASYIVYQGHWCTKKCNYCGKLMSSCTCLQICVMCHNNIKYCMCGKNETPSNGGGGGGGGSTPTPNEQLQSPTPKHPRVTMEELFALSELGLVHLLPNLPNKLYPQPKNANDCTFMAFAFALSLSSGNYYDILNLLKSNVPGDISWDKTGLQESSLEKYFGKYCEIKALESPDEYNRQAIARYIDSGYAVIGSVGDTNSKGGRTLHAVTVFGYDNEYLYVAAGNPVGSANKIKTYEICSMKLYVAKRK